MKRLLPYLLLIALAGCQTTQERPPMDWLSDGTTISEVSQRYGAPDFAGNSPGGKATVYLYGDMFLVFWEKKLINQHKNKHPVAGKKSLNYADPMRGIIVQLVPVSGFSQ